MKRRGVLEAAEWAEDEFGSLVSGGAISLREIMRCVRAGLLVSVGLVVLTDGDGFHLDPERFRPGFKLTAKGRALLRPVAVSVDPSLSTAGVPFPAHTAVR